MVKPLCVSLLLLISLVAVGQTNVDRLAARLDSLGNGTLNNWKYSQRNPDSPMSVLESNDFKSIRQFFSKHAA